MRLRVLFATFLLIFSTVPSFAGEKGNLYDQFSGKNVKVYIEVKDSTTDYKVDPKIVQNELIRVLKERKSILFETVEVSNSAEITVQVDIQGYYWTDHDPIDMIIGIGGTAMDAMTIEDYANLKTVFIVSDARTGEVFWQDTLTASVTKKPMSETESVPLVAEKLAKVFLRDCFSKRR